MWHYVLLFLFGTAAGSFLNVVTWRYKPGRFFFNTRSLRGRSHCPYCKRTLRWFELIPVVSFFIQFGKCRRCGHRLSWQYPIVEVLSGIIVAGVPLFLSGFYNFPHVPIPRAAFYGLTVAWVLVLLTWLVISVIDRRHYIVPDELNILLGALGFFVVGLSAFVVRFALPFHDSFLRHYSLILSPTQDIWVNHLMGAVAGGLFFTFLIVLSRGRAMGWGDAKLALVSGFAVGWPEVALGIVLAFVIGGTWGAFLLVSGRKHMGDKLPFAPFLLLGMVLAIFCGYTIVQWYLGLFGA